jgi:hypothetical protein
MAEKGQALP